MFSFFKKTKNKIKDISVEDIQSYYISKVKTYTWEDYTKLNKYEKVYAFSAKGINHINIINALKEAYFNSKEPHNKTPLSKEIKAEMKNLGFLLKDINSIMTINKKIFYQLANYLRKDSLPMSMYIRITSPMIEDLPLIETKLHNTIFHRDEKELYKYIPPNHPRDHSKIIFLSKKKLIKYNALKINTEECKILLHEDYDFNIYDFIINDYIK
jgi:hypothetical protein